MPPVFTNLGASANPDINDSTDLVGYSGTSWTPPTYGLIVAFVNSRVVGAETPVLVGNNISWQRMHQQTRGDDSVTFFVGNPVSSVTGELGVNFTGSAQSHCELSVFHVTGAYTRGSNGISGSVAQIKGGDAGSGLSLSLSFDNATGTSGNSRPIAAFHHRANQATTPRTNWVEADDLFGAGTTRGLETQWRQSAFEGTASATWVTTSANVGIAAEIRFDGDYAPDPTPVVTVSKGYVLTGDFPQSPVSVTSFVASASATASHEASASSATSQEASSASSTDISASDVEATDL